MKSISLTPSPATTSVVETTQDTTHTIAHAQSYALSDEVRDTGEYSAECVSHEALALLLRTMPTSSSTVVAPKNTTIDSRTHEVFLNELSRVREDLLKLQTDGSRQSCVMAESLALDEAINVSTSAIDGFLSLSASVEANSQRLLSV